MGKLMIGLKKSANARLAIRIFGKVRSFLKRAMIPRTTPLPSTANTAKMGIKTNAQIVMNKESSTSMIFLARPRVKTKTRNVFKEQHRIEAFYIAADFDDKVHLS